LNLRFIIFATLGAVLLLLWMAGYYTWASWRTRHIAEIAVQANDMADKIVLAARYQAIERGATTGALSALGAASQATLEDIHKIRRLGDATWSDAAVIAHRLAEEDVVSPAFGIFLKRAGDAYTKVEEARRRVDSSLRKSERDISAPEWIGVMSDFIAAAARMRISAFQGRDLPPGVVHANITAKHYVWLASEYAGLERATVAMQLNSNAPATPELLQKLKAYRQIVDVNLQEVLALRDAPETDPRVIRAVDAMEKNFLGSFEETRKRVYAELESEGKDGGQRFTLSGREWFEISTNAISSISAVAEAASEASKKDALRISKRSTIQMAGYAAVFIGMLVVSLGTLRILLIKLRHLDRLRSSMEDLSEGEGDLTKRLAADARDEIGRTSAAFNRFIEKMQDIIREVSSNVTQVSEAAEKQAETAEKVALSSHRQSEAAASTAAAVEQITVSIGQVADHARETAGVSRQSEDLSEKGERIVLDAAAKMEGIAESVTQSSQLIASLGQRSVEISGIVKVIREIADQTNLLALNAAIEAARAGEQGRGFAVVADEVRKLAERTGKATVEIGGMIEAIQSETRGAVGGMEASSALVRDGVQLASQAERALAQINEGARQVVERINGIAAATREQSVVSSEIAGNVEKIAQMAEENCAAVGETARDAKHLQQLSVNLRDLVRKFKI
jgi:methyl-accepting chemotaxis protein